MNTFFKYCFFILLLAGVFACKKKADPTLGTDVQPESDILNTRVSDSSTMIIRVIKHDTWRTYNDQFKYLGSNQDPVFGRTNASIFTNFSLPNSVSNISFGEDAVLDSAELILTFTQNFVGDTTTPLLYEIRQLTQAPEKTRSYYMHNTLPYGNTLLCSATRRISKTSGFYTIRLPLDKTFASAILTNTVYLANNSIFQSTYKGFYITTKNSVVSSSANGALMKIDLDNSVSGVHLYYHNGVVPSSKEPKTYRMPFSGDNAARFNNIEYDYLSGGNPELVSQLTDPNNTLYWNKTMYLKGLAGTKMKIEIPFLKNYSDSCPIAVSRAEVVFRVDQSVTNSSGKYEAPLQISLVAIDENGRETYIKDQFSTSDLIKFGGNYDPVHKYYIFNIARHVQDIVAGKLQNYGFYLVLANPDRSYVARRDDKAERVVLGGLNSALYKPTFRLTYIRFPYDK